MERCREIYERIIAQGKEAIEGFIADRKSEELFLDFKRSSNDGADQRLSNIDRKNLAKAISGFGNSEGGVIVWGVDCSLDEDGADVARAEVKLENPRRFVSLLEGAVSGCTIPPHCGIENHVIEDNDNRGFVITLIPKSNSAPHQMLPTKQYCIRAGSDFVPTPHDVLASLFGRRPQPHVFHQYILAEPKLISDQLEIRFGIALHNEGPGIASDIFCTCLMRFLPGTNCQMRFETPDRANWTGSFEFGRQTSLISSPGFRLPPGANAQPLVIHLSLAPPFEGQLKISGSVGAGESRRYEFVIEKNAPHIQRQYELFVQKKRENSFSEGEKHNLASAILGLSEAGGPQHSRGAPRL